MSQKSLVGGVKVASKMVSAKQSTAKSHAKMTKRRTEASQLVRDLNALGIDNEGVAAAVNSTLRTVYRWRDDGAAPHPIFLEALRRYRDEEFTKRGLALDACVTLAANDGE